MTPGRETPGARQGLALIAAGAGVVALVTLLARVAGFGRWLVFSDAVGATCVGDVYTTTNQLPNVLFEVAAGGALAAAAVPLVARQVQRGDAAARDRTASALLTWAVLLLAPLSLLLLLLAAPLAGLLVGGLGCGEGDEVVAAGTLMLAVFSPQVLLYGVGIVLGAILQAHRRFVAAALAPLLSTLVVIATYAGYGVLASPEQPGALRDTGDLLLLAGGTTAGVVVLALPLLVPVRRAGVRVRPTLRFPPGAARTAAALLGAGVAVVAAQQVATLSGVLATGRFGSTGSVAVLAYVQAVYLLPYAVLVVPIAVAAFPALVGAAESPRGGGDPGARPGRDAVLLGRVLRAVLVVALVGAGAVVAAAPAVQEMFTALDVGGGGPGTAALGAMAPALSWFGVGLVGFGLVALLTRAAYATGRGGAAAAVTVAGWALAATGPWVALGATGGDASVSALEVVGISWAAGMSVAGAGLLVVTRRAWGTSVTERLVRTTLVGLPAVVVGALLARLLHGIWATTGFWGAALQAAVLGVIPVLLGLAVLAVADPAVLAEVRRRPTVRGRAPDQADSARGQ